MNPEILDRVPPCDPDAERWVIGSILLRPAVLDELRFLRAEDFYAAHHATMFATLVAMRDNGEPMEVELFTRRLQAAGQFEGVGGLAAIAEIAQGVPVSQHAAHYARIVARKAQYRRMIHTATDLLRDSYAETEPVEDILARAESALLEITTGRYQGAPVDLHEAVVEATIRMEELQDRTKDIGRMTGLLDFDELYGGLFPKELTILAARTGIGKTALATQIAMHNASKGRLVYFVSLEMSREELATRLLCRQAEVNSRDIRAGRLSAQDRAAIVEASQVVASAKLKIHDRPGMTMADIRREARRLAKKGLALVVVDYLQLVIPADRKVPREQQVAAMTRDLKQAAKELDVPILCLCQLNRQADGERPRLAHLRESGAIEQDADMVVFLYQHKPSDGLRDDHNAVLEVAKHRAGEPKCLRLFWHGPTTSFSCPLRGFGEFTQYAQEQTQ